MSLNESDRNALKEEFYHSVGECDPFHCIVCAEENANREMYGDDDFFKGK